MLFLAEFDIYSAQTEQISRTIDLKFKFNEYYLLGFLSKSKMKKNFFCILNESKIHKSNISCKNFLKFISNRSLNSISY